MSSIFYQVRDNNTDRTAVVTREHSMALRHLPFIVFFYVGDRLDYTRRFSTSGLAEAAADEWCGGSGVATRF